MRALVLLDAGARGVRETAARRLRAGGLGDRRGHRRDVGRAADRDVRVAREQVARVAVRNRGEQRAAGGEVLVGLARDEARTASRGQVVHRQEQQVRRPHERDARVVVEVPVQVDPGRVRHALVGVRERAREMELDLPDVLLLARGAQRVHEMHVRPREDVDRLLPAQQPDQPAGSALAQAELGVQRPGVDDPQRPAGAGLGRGGGEVAGVPAVRDRGDPGFDARERLPDRRGGLGRVHHDGRGAGQ